MPLPSSRLAASAQAAGDLVRLVASRAGIRGPDIARVTELKTQAKHWLDMRPHLKDAAAWEKNYANTLDWMREDGSKALPGFMTQLTIIGPLVNTTLFEQAKVPVPGEKATWDK
jgi:alpha-1,4-digalacturonate transport system substrate-binding protein